MFGNFIGLNLVIFDNISFGGCYMQRLIFFFINKIRKCYFSLEY